MLVIDSLDFTKSTAFESKDERTRRLCQKTRTPSGFRRAGFINSGDVLLSRNLEKHYHWGCSVSLPCSEWERVGPLRYDHQKAGEAEASPWGNRQGRSLLNFTRNSGDNDLSRCPEGPSEELVQ